MAASMLSHPKPVRVALLSPLHSNPGGTQGGIESVFMNLANAFAALGLEVDLLVYPPKGTRSRPPNLSDQVNVVDIGHRGKWQGGLAVARYLRRCKPAALLAAGYRCNLMAAIAKNRSRTRSRIVLSVRNTMSRRLAHFGWLKRQTRSTAMQYAYSQADEIIAVSHGVADDLITHFPHIAGRVRVVYNPINFNDIEAKLAVPIDHPWFEQHAPPVLLAVGRLRPQKDYPTLIRAFAKVRERHQCRLVILGEGPERVRIEAIANELGVADHLYMPGIVTNPFPYVRAARLCVMSSAWEGLPNVLLEAMAVGTPIVATDCPSGPREILEDGRHGRLVPVGDATALATSISESLDAPREGECLRRAAKRFEVKSIARAYLDAMGVSEAIKRGKEI